MAKPVAMADVGSCWRLPLVLAAWKLKIYPSIWWTSILGVSLVASVITIFFPNFLIIAAAIDLFLIAVAALISCGSI